MNSSLLEGLSIVVVDPDRDTREMLDVALSAEGARVITVGSVQEALTTLEHFSANIVISELRMPCEDGYDLIRHLRKQEKRDSGATIPVIALTTFATEESYRRARLVGFQGYLTKPVRLTSLYGTIVTLAQEFSGLEQFI